MNLSFNANTGTPREGTLTVKRLLPDGNEDTSVDPVLVTFKQEKSPYVVSLLPNYSVNGLTIEGFRADMGTVNGIVKNVRFSVLLADPEHYTFEATCSFNKDSDAFITKSNENTTATAGPLQTSKTAPSSVAGISGENIWLNVFRTGPGDADIKGDLSVKAVPKDPSSGLAEATYSVSITIKTGCKIGDSKIGSLLLADRNVGTTPRGQEGAIVGLNYTNDVNSDDHANIGFKGVYYTFPQDPGKCAAFGADNCYEGELATGWRVPNLNELNTIASRMCFSKQRVFIVSDDKTQGLVGSWFPISGYLGAETRLFGYLWTSTPADSYGYYFRMGINEVGTSSDLRSVGYTVRCVR